MYTPGSRIANVKLDGHFSADRFGGIKDVIGWEELRFRKVESFDSECVGDSVFR